MFDPVTEPRWFQVHKLSVYLKDTPTEAPPPSRLLMVDALILSRVVSGGSASLEEETHQFGPAGDADLLVQAGGEEDEEQRGEEERRAADELEEVQGGAADAAGHQLLQDEGHQGQELREEREA